MPDPRFEYVSGTKWSRQDHAEAQRANRLLTLDEDQESTLAWYEYGAFGSDYEEECEPSRRFRRDLGLGS